MSGTKTLKELGYEIVPIDRCIKADWNYKKDDKERLKDLIENIKKNGQLENWIVRELDDGKLEIVNGNHRYDAHVALKLNFAVVNNLGKIGLIEAQRVSVETNETRFETDTILLANIIKEMSVEISVDDLAITMPYTDIELTNMIELTDFNWEQFQKNDIPNNEETPQNEKHKCPKCGFEFK